MICWRRYLVSSVSESKQRKTTNNEFIRNQNNFVQIYGTGLSQETIKNLNPEQLNTIESILKTALTGNNPNLNYK